MCETDAVTICAHVAAHAAPAWGCVIVPALVLLMAAPAAVYAWRRGPELDDDQGTTGPAAN